MRLFVPIFRFALRRREFAPSLREAGSQAARFRQDILAA